jgi:hypothetical protein
MVLGRSSTRSEPPAVQSERDSDEVGFRDGVVDVRGGKNKKFKSNWVVVKAGALQYFDTDKFPQGKKPSETIGLLGVQLRQASKKECKAKTDFVFAIRYLPANKKKPEELFFAAKSGEEANLWMRAIGDSIALAAPTLFSIPLHVAIAKSGAPLPAVVLGCMNGLAQRFETDGLFRESPPPEAVMDARTNFDAGTLDVTTADAHVVLALLAMFLRELPEPLGTFGMFPFWLKMAEKDVNPRLEELPEACGSLPPANKTTLQVLLRFLGDAAEKSSATVDDVAAMFGFGTVLRPFMDDDCDAGTTAAINRLFVTMMCNWEHCFGLGDVKDPYAGETPLGGAPPAAAPAAASPAAASSVSPRTSAVATGPPSGSASPALSRASAVSPRASAVTAAAAPAGGALPTISADSPWKALKAKDGRTYYYNKETKETTWKNPLGAEPKSAWQKKETADGRVYYFNPVSKTTSWQPPAGFEEGSGGGGGGGAKTPARPFGGAPQMKLGMDPTAALQGLKRTGGAGPGPQRGPGRAPGRPGPGGPGRGRGAGPGRGPTRGPIAAAPVTPQVSSQYATLPEDPNAPKLTVAATQAVKPAMPAPVVEPDQPLYEAISPTLPGLAGPAAPTMASEYGAVPVGQPVSTLAAPSSTARTSNMNRRSKKYARASMSYAKAMEFKTPEEDVNGDDEGEADEPVPPPPAEAPPPSNWTELTAPDGRVYYYDRVTKKTQWTRPAELEEELPPPPED